MKRSRSAYYYLLAAMLFFCFNTVPAFAQDSTYLALRNFDGTALEKFKNQKEFIYEVDRARQTSLWDLVLYYLGKLLSKLFTGSQQGAIIKVIIYILMIAGVVAVILNLLGIDMRRLFVLGPKQVIRYAVEEENLHQLNLDDSIAKARAEGQWRLCIRYQYLKALRLLSEKEMIQWQQGKTNMDYYYEIRATALKPVFLEITTAFENAWYGHHELNAGDYAAANTGYENFYTMIKDYRSDR